MTQVKSELGPIIPKPVKFLIGGMAGMSATLFVHPLDLVKNRMQLSGEGGQKRLYTSTFNAFQHILKNEGILALYSGLTAGLLRQATYTTVRLGTYTLLFEKFSKDGKPPNFLGKAAIGMAAGAFGAFFGNPAEISLIRMCADGRLPLSERRGYKNVIDALVRMAKEEGILTLWRGVGTTVSRAIVVNAAQLATYSQAKQLLITNGKNMFGDNIQTHFVASMISGLATTVASMPVDIAKTRIQNMKVIDGKPEYKGAIDVMSKIVKKEGLFSLWKGFTPYYARVGPHTILMFIFVEQFNHLYAKYVLKDNRKVASL